MLCIDPRNGKTIHSFASIEAVETYEPPLAYLEPEAKPARAPKVKPEPKPEPVIEAPAAKTLFPEEPVFEEPVRQLDPVPATLPEESTQTASAEETHKIHNLFNNEPQGKKVAKFVPPPARKAPGGVLILTARIPDEYVGAFQTRAVEGLQMSVEEYFQSCVEQALQNAWWF